MKGSEIIEYIVRGDMPDLEEARKKCLRETVNLTGNTRDPGSNKKPMIRKPLLAGIVVVLCLFLVTPACAVNNPVTYELLYSVSPSAAQFFKPVQKSCEYDGIKMEVIAAGIYDNTTELYISLQDMTGDRVDETTDLFDSYSINRPFDCSATCQLISFDEETNTAFFYILITEWGDQKISGKKITFTLKRFLSGKQVYDGLPVNISMVDIRANPDTMTMPIDEYGGGFDGDYYMTEEGPIVLVPSSEVDFGVAGISITGMGYVDGMLHIQTSLGNIWKYDNHGYIYFIDKSGNIIYYVSSIWFNENQNGERVRYYEHVYNIPQSMLDEYEAYGYFVTTSSLTEGYWQVTFPLTVNA